MAAPDEGTNHANAVEHIDRPRGEMEHIVVPPGAIPSNEWCHRTRDYLIRRFHRFTRDLFIGFVPDPRDLNVYVMLGSFVGRDQRTRAIFTCRYVDAEVGITGYLSPVRMRFFAGELVDIYVPTVQHIRNNLIRFLASLRELPVETPTENNE